MGKQSSGYSQLNATPAANDRIPITDVSDTSMSLDGTTKYVEYEDLVPAASETVSGIVELATSAETVTGTDTARAVTPAGVAAAIAAANPSDLTPDAPVSESGTSFTLSSTHDGREVNCSNASLVTVTVPTDAGNDLRDGYRVVLFAAGAGGVTLSTSGVTLLGSSPNKTIAQNEAIYLVKTASANTWMVIGGTSA